MQNRDLDPDIRFPEAELLRKAEAQAEVLQTCGNRAGHRPSEIRPPDDTELLEGYPGVGHQYADGRCCLQHEALDEQKCLIFFCLLVEGAGRPPRECDI